MSELAAPSSPAPNLDPPPATGDAQVDALLEQFHVGATSGADSVEVVAAAQRGLQARLASS